MSKDDMKLFNESPVHKKHHALNRMAFMTWIIFGANALSSVCYGPEQGFLALGENTFLAVNLALLTVISILIFCAGYNHVIELFPRGGSYEAASKLLHPYAGMLTGVALLIGYMLLITVSMVCAIQILFSLLPKVLAGYKFIFEAIGILFLLAINLRGIKETHRWLLFIVCGFMLSHTALIGYGLYLNEKIASSLLAGNFKDFFVMPSSFGLMALLSMLFVAYSASASTFTGIETISDRTHMLESPRIKIAKRAMLYVALTVSLLVAGIYILYMLLNVTSEVNQSLNTSMFHILLGKTLIGHVGTIVISLFEVAILLTAANIGFKNGPAILALMAMDKWVPTRFRYLSSRLAEENALTFLGIAALIFLIWTGGNLHALLVLYSLHIFIAFTLAFLSVSVYLAKQHRFVHWVRRLLITLVAFFLSACLLTSLLVTEFVFGAWLIFITTPPAVIICILIRNHYAMVENKIKARDEEFSLPESHQPTIPIAIDPKELTAVILVSSLSTGLHTFSAITRLFPHQFKNIVFLSAGVADKQGYRGEEELVKVEKSLHEQQAKLIRYVGQYSMPAEGYTSFGADAVVELTKLADSIIEKYPHTVFFATRYIFVNDNMFERFLHNQTALIIQRHLHLRGKELVIVPMKI